MKFHHDRPTHFYITKQLLRAFNLLKQNSGEEMSKLINSGDTTIDGLKQFILFSSLRRDYYIPHGVYSKNLGAERFHPTNRKRLLEWPHDEIPLCRADMYDALTHPDVPYTWIDGALVYLVDLLARKDPENLFYSEFHFNGGVYQGLVLNDPQASTDAVILFGNDVERRAFHIVGTKKRLNKRKRLTHGRARALRDFGDTSSISTKARGFEFEF